MNLYASTGSKTEDLNLKRFTRTSKLCRTTHKNFCKWHMKCDNCWRARHQHSRRKDQDYAHDRQQNGFCDDWWKSYHMINNGNSRWTVAFITVERKRERESWTNWTPSILTEMFNELFDWNVGHHRCPKMKNTMLRCKKVNGNIASFHHVTIYVYKCNLMVITQRLSLVHSLWVNSNFKFQTYQSSGDVVQITTQSNPTTE